MHAQCTVTVSGTTVKMSNGTLSAEISGQAYVKKLNLGGINLLTSNGIYYDYTTTDMVEDSTLPRLSWCARVMTYGGAVH